MNNRKYSSALRARIANILTVSPDLSDREIGSRCKASTELVRVTRVALYGPAPKGARRDNVYQAVNRAATRCLMLQEGCRGRILAGVALPGDVAELKAQRLLYWANRGQELV